VSYRNLTHEKKGYRKKSERIHHTFARFHATITDHNDKKRRTTISLEEYIADFLAVYLGQEPRTKEARSKITEYIQREISFGFDDSYSIKRVVLNDLVDNTLFDKYAKFKKRQS
jgi:hypothetical protein